jgi:hypothetical protein
MNRSGLYIQLEYYDNQIPEAIEKSPPRSAGPAIMLDNMIKSKYLLIKNDSE